MAKVKPIRPVDRVAFEPAMIALHEARALAWFLEQLGDEESRVRYYIEDSACDEAEDVIPWVHQAIAHRLRTCHDEIEREYRKLGTNLLAKEATAFETPKDGA